MEIVLQFDIIIEVRFGKKIILKKKRLKVRMGEVGVEGARGRIKSRKQL